MAGLVVPAIHDLLWCQGVDARDKRGHDGGDCCKSCGKCARAPTDGHQGTFFKRPTAGEREDDTNAVDRQLLSPFEYFDSKDRWQVTRDLLPILTFIEAREHRAAVRAEIDSRWIALVTR